MHLVDGLDKVAAGVLGLARLFQARDARTLDPDEDGRDVGIAQEAQQLLVLGDIQRHLRVEVEGVVVLFPPRRHRAQQLLGELLVPDEVVVNQEHLLGAQPTALADLLHHLLDPLHARPTPIDDDDVAELAVEGTAPRELDGKRVVGVHVEQVKARHGRQAHVGFLFCRVLGLPGPRLEVVHELRPGLLGLAVEQNVAVLTELVGTQRGVGSADGDEAPPLPELAGDLPHAALVHDVAGDPNHVGIHVEVDLFDILVAERDLVPGRRETRHGGHREVREDAAAPESWEDRVVGPEALGVARSDQMDLHAVGETTLCRPTNLSFFGKDPLRRQPRS